MQKVSNPKFSAMELQYRPSIDGLRAIAVMSVVVFHAFPQKLRGGFAGVDIFFVISGYLITTIILTHLDKKHFSFMDFYGRRIRRIFPALITVFLVCYIAGWLFLMPHEFAQLGKHILGGAAFVSNLVSLNEIGYFDVSSDTKPLLHLWSLGVEEQFYIFWPLICVLIYRLRMNFLGMLGILLAVSFVTCVVSVYIDRDFSFYFPVSRFWELGAGAAVAWMASRPDRALFDLNQRLADWLSVIGLILVIVSFFVITRKRLFPGFWPLIPTIGTMLLIAAGETAWINRRILSLKAFVWIGLISYPLYLWHWPLLSFVRIAENTFREAPEANRWIALALSIGLAWLTYASVEKWFRFGTRRQAKTALLIGMMTGAGGLGYITMQANGFPNRIQVRPPAAMAFVSGNPHPLKNVHCKNQYPAYFNQWSCLLSKPKPADAILVGDSHAHQYFRAMANELSNQSILNISSPGCLPFVADAWMTPRCVSDTKRIVELIRTSHSIKTVYITGYFSLLMAGSFQYGNIEGQRIAAPLTAAAKASFLKNAAAMLNELTSQGKKIVFIGDIPDLVFRPAFCIRTSSTLLNKFRFSSGPADLGPETCSLEKAGYYQRIAPYDEAISSLLRAFPTISFFDPRPVICDDKRCWAIRNGTALYWNSDHLTYEGSLLIIKKMIGETKP